MTNFKRLPPAALVAAALLTATPGHAQEQPLPWKLLGKPPVAIVIPKPKTGDLLPPRTARLDEIAGVPGAATRIMIGQAEVSGHDQYGTAGFFLGETWSEAVRVATKLCGTRGFAAGHFNGHQNGTGSLEVLCSGPGAIWRDAKLHEIGSTGWTFTDVNRVGWAHANRAAERLCAAADQSFAGGHFTGHQIGDNVGLYCYRDGARWFDATDADLIAAKSDFLFSRLEDVTWAQAMRAAFGFCQARGYDGGFMNGHQLPNKSGVVCQK